MKIDTNTHQENTRSDVNIHPPASKTILKTGLNFIIALLLCAAVNLALHLDYITIGDNVGEVSVTEFAEQFLLLIAAGSFFYLARIQHELKHAAVLISAFFFVMIIRENDQFFDLIHHGFWIYPALLTTLAAIVYAAKNGKNTLNQLAVILESKYMNLLIVGLAILLVYSRLFGMGDFWKQVMQENYVRIVKDIAEEGSELLAYSIIALASVKIVRTLKAVD